MSIGEEINGPCVDLNAKTENGEKRKIHSYRKSFQYVTS